VIVRSTSTADAATSVSARLSNFKISAPSSAEHGRVTFRVRNSADIEHEMVVIRTDRRASALPTSSSGKASERGSKGEVEVDGGESKRLTLTLPAGHYVLICNIGGHYRAGMRANFTVR
jgi:uncharacterized cupredoxin-like copper-binding protein